MAVFHIGRTTPEATALLMVSWRFPLLSIIGVPCEKKVRPCQSAGVAVVSNPELTHVTVPSLISIPPSVSKTSGQAGGLPLLDMPVVATTIRLLLGVITLWPTA